MTQSQPPQIDWINRLAKWRSVFAGWQLGTRPITDPECQAVRDHREATLMLRAETNAIAALLVEKGVFTADEFTDQVNYEAKILCEAFNRRFPGFEAVDEGLKVDARSADTTRDWKP